MSHEDELTERAFEIWRVYKFHIIITLLMIVSAVAGLSYQSVVVQEQRRATGIALFKLISAAEANDLTTAKTVLEEIDGDSFPKMHGLALAALAAAQNKAGDYGDAADALRIAAENETDDGLRQIIILRLAEALINDGKTEEALAILEEESPASPDMNMLFIERRGDAYYAAGKPQLAREEYQNARASALEQNPQYAALLDIKISATASLPSAAEDENAVEDENNGESQ